MELECYFSHSWRAEDVPLNILVWRILADSCVLYVDREGAESGTYYINRLEELIRKSDVFVSMLAYRKNEASSANKPDYQMACSPGALFEVRLAERARKPRWIVYDDRVGLVPTDAGGELVVYTPITATEELERDGSSIRTDGTRWLQRIRESLKAGSPRRSRRAALLINGSAADAGNVRKMVQAGLRSAGYGRVDLIESVHTDAEAIEILQSSGLLVAEIGAPSVGEFYGMAHAMFIPTIRFIRPPWRGNDDIPRLLDGHPGGYQHDLIIVEDPAKLTGEVEKRAHAMRDERKPISGLMAGSAYLRRKLYRRHNVFFSHNIPTADADLLRLVFAGLERHGIRAWEYRQMNHAGVVWSDELRSELSDATDVVFIFAKDFELSRTCSEELRAMMARRQELKSITPFLWGDRDKPNPELESLHHEALPKDVAAAADIIVERLVPLLRANP